MGETCSAHVTGEEVHSFGRIICREDLGSVDRCGVCKLTGASGRCGLRLVAKMTLSFDSA
jgi:hypothetical protein